MGCHEGIFSRTGKVLVRTLGFLPPHIVPQGLLSKEKVWLRFAWTQGPSGTAKNGWNWQKWVWECILCRILSGTWSAPYFGCVVAQSWVNQGFWMALQAGISIWWANRFGGKFKSHMGFPRNSKNIITQHALVENGGGAVRVVPWTMLEGITCKKLHQQGIHLLAVV